MLVDDEDQQQGASIIDSGAGRGFGGSVTAAAGDTRLGWITFEIPDTSRPSRLQFTLDSGFGPETGGWRLEI